MVNTNKNSFFVILPILAIFALLALSLFLRESKQNSTSLINSTPKSVIYSSFENEVLNEINSARTSPATYVKYIEGLRPHFNERRLNRPGKPALITKEGLIAVEEAIHYLYIAKPAGALSFSSGLALAARDHAADQGPKGAMGHTGSDRSSLADRSIRYGQWQTMLGENIHYGESTARDIVMGWIIDDDVPSRGHREILFNPLFHVVGIASGPHRDYGTMCVADFAGAFIEK